MRQVLDAGPFKGFQVFDGYFHRLPRGLYFYNRKTKRDGEHISYPSSGDMFCLKPFELLKLETWREAPLDEWCNPIREELFAHLANKKHSVKKLFFPHSVRRIWNWRYVAETEYRYYLVIQEVWRQWEQSGAVDPRWWEALAYSLCIQVHGQQPNYGYIDTVMGVTIYRQVVESTTKEDVERVIEIVRPRPAGESFYLPERPLHFGNAKQVIAA